MMYAKKKEKCMSLIALYVIVRQKLLKVIITDIYGLYEVEILEDNTEEIEELDIPASKMIYDVEPLKDKINELVKAVNKLRKEKE